jgi:hypothetical protein
MDNQKVMTSTLFQLEAADEYGLEGLPDRERLLQWLESWIRDDDSRECKLTKLDLFSAKDYTN